MAEKRVSVRLAAVGGRQVRAELEGVGEAGKRGFGRLSREMEAANARLAAFSRRARVAVTAAGAAISTGLVAITRSTIQAAHETQQFARIANAAPEAFQRWAGASRTVGIEQDKLADILKDVNDRVGDFLSTGGGPMADFFEKVAPRVGVTADQFARLSGPEALQLYVSSMERAGLSQQQMTFYLEAMASDATRLLPLLRNGGAEMGRLGSQAEDLGAVLDASAIQALQRTQIALIGVGQVFEGLRNRIGVALAPAVEWLANAFVGLASQGGALRVALDALIDNIGRLATYAATFAALMAGRWVAGLAAAAISVRGLATALVVMRGALIRTGIGALIVGAGELVYQFTRLVRGAGGFGEAMSLLGDVAMEIWDRIKLGGQSLSLALQSVWASIQAGWLSALEKIQKTWADFLHAVARGLDGIPGMESTMLGVYGAAVRAGSAYYEMAGATTQARAEADRLAASARAIANAAAAPLTSIEALRQAFVRAGADGNSALTDATNAADRVTSALDTAEKSARTAGAAGKAAGENISTGAEASVTGWQAVTAALSDYAGKAREIGGDIGQSLVGAFQSAENAVGEFVKTGKLNFRDLVTSLLADLAKLAARRFILGPIANALSGVFSGAGGIFANVLHAGGMVGSAGPSRMVPAMAFATAPRMHGGGMAGLRHDEVPAILQRGERVLSRREAQSYGAGGGVNVTIIARDAESFRQSRTQVAADIARAVSLGRRGM